MDGQLNSQDNRVYNLRLATEDDIEVVLEMGRQFYKTTEMAKQIPFDDDSAIVQFFKLVDDGFIILAEHLDEVVGMIGCSFFDFPFNVAHQGCAETMYWINEEHRGGTLAMRLIREAEMLAVSDGASFVVMAALETSPTRIEEFYGKLGYQRSERAFVKGV